MDIIPALFNLSLPGQSASTPRPPTSPALANLPVLPLNTKTATSILRLTSMLKRHEVATHFAHHFLEDKDVLATADLPFFCMCISAFAETRDVNGFLSIINSYQPPGVEDAGWPLATWHTMLNACRWAKDWRSALIIFRKMTHLPEGIEKGKAKEWKPQTRPQSKKFLKDAYNRASEAEVDLDPDTLPKTVRLSLVSDPVSQLAALSISQRKGVQWSLILLEDVERSLTKVLESVKVEEKELEQLESLKADVSRLLLKWEKVNTSDGIRYQT